MGLIDFGGTLSGIGSLVSAGAQWYSAYNNNKNSEKANDINQESLDWQKTQWEQTKEREDNAVQRRVADLRAAGLSPTLAAGSAASSSTAPTLPQIAPQQYHNPAAGIKDAFNGLTQLLRMKQEYDKTQAEISLLEQQERESEGNLINKLAQSDYYQSQTRGSNLANAQSEFNNGLLNARWLNEQELFRQSVLNSEQGRKLSEAQISRSGVQNTTDEFRRDVWAHDIITRLGLDSVMNQAKIELMSTQALENQVKTRETQHDLDNAIRAGVNSKDASAAGKILRDLFGKDDGSVREKLRAPLEVLKKPIFDNKSKGRTPGTRQKNAKSRTSHRGGKF